MSMTTPNSNKLVEESYDKIAAEYLDWTLSTPSPRLEYLATLLKHLPDPSKSRVLELGCGAGVPGTQFLAKSCEHVIGVDISSAQVKLAKKHVKEGSAEFMQSDMLALKFDKGTFDAVVGLYSILHLTKADQLILMEKIRSWLRPGGYFVGNFALTEIEATGTWLGGEKMFWGGWEKEEWLGKMKDGGLELLEGNVVKDVEHGRDVRFLWVLAKS